MIIQKIWKSISNQFKHQSFQWNPYQQLCVSCPQTQDCFMKLCWFRFRTWLSTLFIMSKVQNQRKIVQYTLNFNVVWFMASKTRNGKKLVIPQRPQNNKRPPDSPKQGARKCASIERSHRLCFESKFYLDLPRSSCQVMQQETPSQAISPNNRASRNPNKAKRPTSDWRARAYWTERDKWSTSENRTLG